MDFEARLGVTDAEVGPRPLKYFESETQQRAQTLAHVNHDPSRRLRFEHDSSSVPVQVLDVVGENDPGDLSASG